MTLAQRIQEIRSAAGPLLRDAPGDMTGYIMKIDGICHDVQGMERQVNTLTERVASLEAMLRRTSTVICSDKSNGDVLVDGRWTERDQFVDSIHALLGEKPPAPAGSFRCRQCGGAGNFGEPAVTCRACGGAGWTT